MQGTEREKIAHLLRRFGLGASENEIDFYAKDGLKGAIDKLLDYENTPEAEMGTQEEFLAKQGNLRPDLAALMWTHRIVRTQRPLQEKMTIFWHHHFATSSVKVSSGFVMNEQIEILRRNATGSFPALLTEVSKDPAMLYWLDNHLNVAGKPNENFAREVMELFTLGIGHYTEKDVQEAARAFTGWSYVKRRNASPDQIPNRTKFIFNPGEHDRESKTVLGKTGNLDGDAVLELLCAHPQTSLYVTTKIWKWFIDEEPDPATIEKYASVFRKSNLNIKALLRAIMEGPELYASADAHKLYKNPVDFTVSTLRQLGLGTIPLKNAAGEIARGVYQLTKQACTRMGMELLAPPDVNGWATGPSWITSATMVERIRWSDRLFGRNAGRGNLGLNYPIFNLLTDRTPDGLVDKLLSVFDAKLPEAKVKTLKVEAAKISGGAITRVNANETAQAVCRMIFGSPEFQLC